jgi:hypothetical protein
MARLRQRQAAGLVVLPVVIDQVSCEVLCERVGLLPPGCEHSREALADAVERLLASLARLDA